MDKIPSIGLTNSASFLCCRFCARAIYSTSTDLYRKTWTLTTTVETEERIRNERPISNVFTTCLLRVCHRFLVRNMFFIRSPRPGILINMNYNRSQPDLYYLRELIHRFQIFDGQPSSQSTNAIIDSFIWNCSKIDLCFKSMEWILTTFPQN